MYSAMRPWDERDRWADVLQGDFRWSQHEAFKTKSFVDTFVDYNKSWLTKRDMTASPGLYNYWKDVPYKSKRPKLCKLHEQFRGELKELNAKWKWLVNLDDLAASTSF